MVERRNRTLNERAKSMRLLVQLPKTFWADTVNTTMYMISRGPSTSLDYRTLKEVWNGKEVNFSSLIVLDCLSYIDVDYANRTKLNLKSKKCFFIGYDDAEFGYHFWDDQYRKIISIRID